MVTCRRRNVMFLSCYFGFHLPWRNQKNLFFVFLFFFLLLLLKLPIVQILEAELNGREDSDSLIEYLRN